jgi:hypothetical protein
MPFMNPTFNLQSENRRPSRFTSNRDSSYRIFCACPNVDDGQHVDGLRGRYSPGWRVLDFKPPTSIYLANRGIRTANVPLVRSRIGSSFSANLGAEKVWWRRIVGRVPRQSGGYRRRVASQGFAEEAIFDVGMCSSFGWRCCGRVDTASDRKTPYHSACNFEFLSGSAEASRHFSMVRQNELVRQ